MLRTFLEVEVDECGNKRAENSNKVLFTGGVIDIGATQKTRILLKISQINNCEYLNHQGLYPVIFVNFKDVMWNSWQEVESMLRLMLGKIYIQHKYIACYLHNIITNPCSNYADEHEATEFLKKYNRI